MILPISPRYDGSGTIGKSFVGRPNKSSRKQNRSSFFLISEIISQISINGTKDIKEKYGPQTEYEVRR